MTHKQRLPLLVATALTLAATTASAETVSIVATDSPFSADFEVDPLAYALGGHSLHVGIGYDRFRLDLGNFALDIPQSVHGQAGFETGFTGFGAKLDVFWRRDRTGAFVSMSAGVGKSYVTETDSRVTDRSTQVTVGGRVGWRFALPADFFVSPWIGVEANPTARDVVLNGRTFETATVNLFPTVHLGYEF